MKRYLKQFTVILVIGLLSGCGPDKSDTVETRKNVRVTSTTATVTKPAWMESEENNSILEETESIHEGE